MPFTIIQKFDSYWEVFCGTTFVAGPFGALEEARDWVSAHSTKEFETKGYHKKDFDRIAKEILGRQPNLFNKLKDLG